MIVIYIRIYKDNRINEKFFVSIMCSKVMLSVLKDTLFFKDT